MNSVSTMDQKLIRIGVFYDGNFFLHVSNYYLYHHERNARISIDGLHTFIKHKAAEFENVDPHSCTIVDAHYFRGRLPSKIAEERNRLLGERVFEDILLRQNITTHYLPMNSAGGEKGIDVWLALETYELAVYKQFNVVVLIAGDGDFLPLVRKLHTIGTRVMLLAWDFKYTGENGEERETRTAQTLLHEATYPVMMSNLIDDRTSSVTPLVNNLFLPVSTLPRAPRPGPVAEKPADDEPGTVYEGVVKKLKEGYGFIQAPQVEGDIFFFHGDLIDLEFTDLQEGDEVEFKMGTNSKGVTAKEVRLLE